MNFKNIVYIYFIILLIINLIYIPKTYATTIDDIIRDGDSFLEVGDAPEAVIDETQLKATSSTIYKILLAIAICVSVIIGAILGINFILGSVEGKAKVMEALAPYIIGCFVVFGAFTIWSTVVNIGQEVTFTREEERFFEMLRCIEEGGDLSGFSDQEISAARRDIVVLRKRKSRRICLRFARARIRGRNGKKSRDKQSKY